MTYSLPQNGSLAPRLGTGGFSLIEVLTVIGIVACLAALVVPVTQKGFERAKIAESQNNLRQIGVAARLYESENNGRLPVANGSYDGGASVLWIERLWPYAKNKEVYPSLGATSSPEVFKGTIFYTPMVEKKTTAPLPRSFAWNDMADDYTSVEMRSAAFNQPSKVCLVADTKTSSALQSSQVNFRNKGKAHILFMDGHIEALSSSQVPAGNTTIFWRGSE